MPNTGTKRRFSANKQANRKRACESVPVSELCILLEVLNPSITVDKDQLIISLNDVFNEVITINNVAVCCAYLNERIFFAQETLSSKAQGRWGQNGVENVTVDSLDRHDQSVTLKTEFHTVSTWRSHIDRRQV